MPDFEALIRHQQLKQPNTNKRLKVVDKTSRGDSISSSINSWNISTYFFVGFFGALIGAGTILFLDINQLIPLEFLKM
tara:strand:- start:502 stop:735 length:234 start_codon:yes stop_codon:yes gene_type:complete